MSEIITSLVHEHEIVKAEDFTFAFQSIIKNITLLDRMLSAVETDYIKGGRVIAAGGFNVRIEPIWGNGRFQEVPLFCDEASALIPVAPALEQPRIDTVQVKGVMEDWDIKRRAFYNPELENGQYFMVPTKSRVSVACQVKRGDDGSVSAPDADEGWIKIAEIAVEPETAAIEQSDIKNVTAIYQGEENAFWTNQKARTFALGGLNEVRLMFGLGHNIDGSHRAEVIKTANIKDAAVTTAKLADGAVTTAKIADRAITAAKIAEGAGGIPPDEATIIKNTDGKLEVKDGGVTSAKIAESPNLTGTPTAPTAAEGTATMQIATTAFVTTAIDAVIIQVQENAGKIALLWDAIFADMTSNPFMFTFADLSGITFIHGVWNNPLQRLEC
jgi:hypothetical protein